MYIVNTSFMVDPAIHDRWLESLRKHYLRCSRHMGIR